VVELKSAREIQLMQDAGILVAKIHKELKKLIKPGVSSMEIDEFVEEYMARHGAKPAQKGYQGYPFATCASVNDEICHGFPRKEPLRSGDVITVDFVADLNGGLADSAWTYTVGDVPEEAEKICEAAKKALYLGIEAAVPGNRTGDIGAAIEEFIEPFGYGIVRDFAGHGIGPSIHEEPNIPHFGRRGRGQRLKEGMAITIEPMINTGLWPSKMDKNGWTARTIDGSLSVQYEHTIIIAKSGPLILTEQDNIY
jgi:methionyl aminopeptidase